MGGDLPVIVFRSRRRRACEERQLVLTAVGVVAELVPGPGEFVLQVDAQDAAYAARHLAAYEAENRAPPAAPPPPRLYPGAWIGCIAYAATLLGVAWTVGGGHVRLDAFDLGTLDCARVQAGEWWRAWTALTLHLDGPHLAANLGAGIWFGYLAARQLGVGTAWLLTVTGAALANLTEGLVGPAAHVAVGASTAVFTALGLMSAYSWRQRFYLPQHWGRRWAPLVAGVVLLGWTGSAGEGTDLVAHLAGFLVGVLLGIGAAARGARRFIESTPQWLSGGAALGSIAIAWTVALRS